MTSPLAGEGGGAVDSAADRVDTPSFDLNFSGGGLRAAYFSLGVTLYMIDNDLCQNVRSVSSVSGGSIINLALAVGGDLADGDRAALRRRLRHLAVELAKQGSFFVRTLRAGVVVGVAAAVLIVTITASLRTDPTQTLLGRIESVAEGALLSAGIVATVSLALFWLFRGPIQRRTYAQLLGQLCSDLTQRRGSPINTLGALPDTEVSHVFCATELVSGTPFYMSRTWTYCPAYGSARLGDLQLSSVLYASAAFPVAFPPLKVQVIESDWTGGAEVDRPRCLWLGDGGIFNNLGTEWRQDLATARDRDRETTLGGPAPASHRVIINASSPATVADIGPALRRIRQFFRMVSIMYENTVRLRLDVALTGTTNAVVIDIKESPIDAARRALRLTSGPAQCRAQESLNMLERYPPGYWHKFNVSASRVKTTLDAVGTKQAAHLLRHAYLSAAVTFNAHFGTAGLDGVWRQNRFFQFVSEENVVDTELADE